MFSGIPNDLERHLKLLGWGLHGLGLLGLAARRRRAQTA
jgi:hypothetical protein